MREISSRRAQTRSTLIEAATRVFAVKGIDASVEELCEAAGFTRGAFYSNFSSKTELCAAVLEHYMQHDLGVIRMAIPVVPTEPSTPDKVIDGAIDSFIALWGVDVDVLLTQHLIRLAAAHDEELRAAVLRVDATMSAAVAPMLGEAFDRHGIVPALPPDTLLMVLRSVYLGSLLDDYIAGNLDFDILRTRLAMVLKALIVQGGA